MNEITIQLEYPLKLNEIEVREMTLKRPKLGHFAKTQNLAGFEQTIKLISLVSGVQPLLIEQMDMVDLRKCTEFFETIAGDENPSPL